MRRGQLFFLFLFIAACNSNTPVTLSPGTGIVTGPILEMATVNWGIAPGVVDLATPRIPAMAEEIKKMRGIGVLCFEELWTWEAKQAAINALGEDLYYIYHVETRGENQLDGVNVCTPSQINGPAACARKKCAALPTEEQSICAYNECRQDLIKLYLKGGLHCIECLIASVGHSTDDVVKNCEQTDPRKSIAGVSRAYEGQNGMLLASRWPLKNQEALRLRASFSNRVALFATVELKKYEPIEIACTHISTTNELLPDHPDFSSWDEEMSAQISDISARLNERAGGRPSILLGDMNAGPDLGGWISESSPIVWSRIKNLGFFSPAANAGVPFCTICADNTLRSVRMADNQMEVEYAKKSYLIDHVLARDPSGGTELDVVSVSPFLKERQVFKGYGERMVERHLSDHYGVVVSFRLRSK